MVQLFRPGPEGRHTPGLLTEIVCLPAVPALIIGNHLRRRPPCDLDLHVPDNSEGAYLTLRSRGNSI